MHGETKPHVIYKAGRPIFSLQDMTRLPDRIKDAQLTPWFQLFLKLLVHLKFRMFYHQPTTISL